MLSDTNLVMPSIRYRLFFPLKELNSIEPDYQFEVLSFYSESTTWWMGKANNFLKVYSFFRDLLVFLWRILCHRKKYDIIIVKNYLVPLFGDTIEKILFSVFTCKKLFYDIDDGIYLNSTRKENRLFARFRLSSVKVGYWARNADIVIACNNILAADMTQKYSLPVSRFRVVTTYPYRAQYFENTDEIEACKKSDKVTFIWLGSSHTQTYLYLCKEFIQQINAAIDNAEFILIGTDENFHDLDGIANVRKVKWSLEEEVKYMRLAHFGLNPLRDSEFERRKCAFKVIQYYRAGIVPLASAVGFNKDLINKFGGYYTDDFSGDSGLVKYVLNRLKLGMARQANHLYDDTKCLSIENNAKTLRRLMNE